MNETTNKPFAVASMVASCVLIVALFPAAAFAQPSPAKKPGLHLEVPTGWTQKQATGTNPKMPASIEINAPAGAGPMRLKIQPIPIGARVLNDDQIKQIITDMAKPMVEGSAEKEVKLTKVEGSASGYRCTLTPAKAAPGKAIAVTNVVVQMPGLALAVAVTHLAETPALDKAIDVIRTATYDAPATPPAP
ncbi:MAG TPA: hypothetical protein VF595_18085 [Tepidisphaeraceae bacterium]